MKKGLFQNLNGTQNHEPHLCSIVLLIFFETVHL